MFSNEEKKQLRVSFWERFKQYSAVRRLQKKRPAKFMMNNTGISQLKLKFEFTETMAIVGIEVETRNVDKRIEIFGKLERLKTIFETKLKQEMIWELDFLLPTGKSVSRTYLALDHVNIYDEESWPKVFPFFYKNMMIIEDTYLEYRDYLKYGEQE